MVLVSVEGTHASGLRVLDQQHVDVALLRSRISSPAKRAFRIVRDFLLTWSGCQLISPASLCLAQAVQDSTFDHVVVLEQASQMDAARAGYQDILKQHPDARAALLGLARVARAQFRFDEARAIYLDLLSKQADDVDAINGLAWIALVNRHVNEARSGFDQALDTQPANAEAKAGLAAASQTHRYHIVLKMMIESDGRRMIP